MRGIRAKWFVSIGTLMLTVLMSLAGLTWIVMRTSLYSMAQREAVLRTELAVQRIDITPAASVDAWALIERLMASPDVLGVEVLNRAGGVLASRQRRTAVLSACYVSSNDRGSVPRVFPSGPSWCVWIPIGSAKNEGSPAWLYAAYSTAIARATLREFTIGLTIVWIVWTVVGGWIIWQWAHWLARPLIGLVSSLQSSQVPQRLRRFEVSDSSEWAEFAARYNALLDCIERQAAQLEEIASQRADEVRRATERAVHAEGFRFTFMVHVSHEMRTPLHVVEAHARDVLNELEFVDDGDAVRSQIVHRSRSHIAVILRETDELGMRLAQILELSRAESTPGAITQEWVDLQDFADDIRPKIEPLARRHGNLLLVDADDAEVLTDRDKLLQIVANLATNACKFTEGGVVEISLRRTENIFAIDVRDTGRGIPEEARALIWQEFWQVDMTEGRRFGGFGLGLAIVRRYTQLLGGTASVTSRVGEGTTISVRIPILRSEVAIESGR